MFNFLKYALDDVVLLAEAVIRVYTLISFLIRAVGLLVRKPETCPNCGFSRLRNHRAFEKIYFHYLNGMFGFEAPN